MTVSEPAGHGPAAESGSSRRGLGFAVLGVGGFSMLGLALSLLNQILSSSLFGTSTALDGYWLAYSWLLLGIGFVGPFCEALAPLVFGKLTDDPEAARDYLAGLLGWLVLALALVFIGIAGMAAALHRTAQAGLPPDRLALPLAVLSPAVFLAGLASVLNRLLSCLGKPVAQNGVRLAVPLGTLFAILAFGQWLGPVSLGIGFVLSQLLMLAVQWRMLARMGLPPRIGRPGRLDRKFLLLAASMMIGSVAPQMVGVFQNMAFLQIQGGVVSAFQYAGAITSAVVAMTGQVVANAIYPRLLSGAAEPARHDVDALFSQGMHCILFMTVWICGMGWIFAPDLVVLLFKRGSFDQGSADVTAMALRMMLPGAIPTACNFLLSSLMFAFQAKRAIAYSGILPPLASLLIVGVFYVFDTKTLLYMNWTVSNSLGLVAALFFAAGLLRNRWKAVRLEGWKLVLIPICAGVSIGAGYIAVEGISSVLVKLSIASLLSGLIYLGLCWKFHLVPKLRG